MATKSIIDRGIVGCFPTGTRSDNILTAVDLQRNMLNSIVEQIDHSFFTNDNLVFNTTHLNVVIGPNRPLDEFANYIRSNNKIDNVFLISLIDNINDPFEIMIHNRKLNVIQIGYINNEKYKDYYVPVMSILIKYLFENYNETDILLDTEDPVKYLCYQNKPHFHRQMLTHKLIKSNLLGKGTVTLNQGDYKFSNLYTLSSKDEPEDLSKEDPFTLGPMSTWKKCFLNVISENNLINKYFITEKTYKPILGLRPFILFGNPGILKYLEGAGFYTFEEYWNVNFREQTTEEEIANATVTVIDQICQMTSTEILNLYKEMLPKLMHNRNRFFEHANEQENKIYSLFRKNV